MRFYSSVAQQSTLTASITPSSTTIQLSTTTGFPGSTPFTLSLDYGSAGEELVDVTAIAGLSLTVTRAVDGTSAQSHNAGAIVRHVSSGRDFAEMQTHIGATANVHGVTGAGNDLVGTLSTQSLSNKSLVRATGTLQNVDIFNVGSFRTTVIGDSTQLNQTRLAILQDEISLRTMASFGPTGALTLIKDATDIDNTYRIRVTDTDGTTDRFYALAGGTMAVIPTSTASLPGVNYVAPDLSTAKRAIRVAAAGGGSERFTVWNDGRVDIVGSATNFSTFDVTAPAGTTSDMMRVLDSGSNTMFAVQQDGRTLANRGATVAQPGVTSGAVLNVGGSNVGYTGNLTQWVGPANNVVAQVNQAGNINTLGTLSVSGATSLQSTSATSLTSTGTVSGATVQSTGKVIGQNIRAGTTSTPAPGGAPAQTTVNVTFSSAMTATPSVNVTASTTAANLNNSNIRWAVTNESTTGFTINCWRDTNFSTNFNYIAIVE